MCEVEKIQYSVERIKRKEERKKVGRLGNSYIVFHTVCTLIAWTCVQSTNFPVYFQSNETRNENKTSGRLFYTFTLYTLSIQSILFSIFVHAASVKRMKIENGGLGKKRGVPS